MPSHSLNLSSLSLAGACDRLSRLDAAGGPRLPRLFSPSAPSSHGETSASSAKLIVDSAGLGATADGLCMFGESSVFRGSVFIMMSDLCNNLCCGAVTGGVKFCKFGVDSCSFAAHTKKVRGGS